MRTRVAALCVGTEVAFVGNTGSPQGASRRHGLTLPASFPGADEETGLDWLVFPRESLECPQQQLSPRQRKAHLQRLAWASTRRVTQAKLPPMPGAWVRERNEHRSTEAPASRRASQGREGMQLPRLPVSRIATVRWELSHQDIVGAGPATVKRREWPLDWQPPLDFSGSTNRSRPKLSPAGKELIVDRRSVLGFLSAGAAAGCASLVAGSPQARGAPQPAPPRRPRASSTEDHRRQNHPHRPGPDPARGRQGHDQRAGPLRLGCATFTQRAFAVRRPSKNT